MSTLLMLMAATGRIHIPSPHLQMTPASLVTEVGSIFGILQAVKQVPTLAQLLTGRIGVAFNIAFAICSTVVLSGTLNTNTILTALGAALAAAGLHANYKVMSGGTVGASGLTAAAAAHAATAPEVKPGT